jgi:hypothetical protein
MVKKQCKRLRAIELSAESLEIVVKGKKKIEHIFNQFFLKKVLIER